MDYLVGRGSGEKKPSSCAARVMSSLLTDFAGFFLNLHGLKAKRNEDSEDGGTPVSATKRVGIKKFAPVLFEVIQSK